MKTINENMKIKNLSKYACQYEDGIRFKKANEDIRPCFYHDIDNILYSLSYIRYMDKTQVFTHGENDHLSKRMTHVQYVSKIARTIGRALNLNEDLIEAASLGHDLGHPPFGHLGERILNKISLENNEGYFHHNIQSVRLLMKVENYGNGFNITLQTLDAIMAHNGEELQQKYKPIKKSKNDFLEEYQKSYKDEKVYCQITPMTLEGCVVRISDAIAYIGKDIEDAVRLKIVKFKDIPLDITNILGTSNREIINNVILDIIKNSYNKNYILLSKNIYKALVKLKNFNYQFIYNKIYNEEEMQKIEKKFRVLFKNYLKDLKTKNIKSNIYKNFYLKMSNKYKENTLERIVIDYISGMTDSFLIKEYQKIE